MKFYSFIKPAMVFVLLVIANTGSNVHADQLLVPTLHEANTTYDPQLGNDVYFVNSAGGNPFHAQIHTHVANEWFVTDGPNSYYYGSENPGSPFTPQEANVMQQLSNNSNDDNSIVYSQRYHDLMNNSKSNLNNTNLIENYILQADELYGFTFKVNTNDIFKPLVLDISILTDWSSVTFSFEIISPNGDRDARTRSVIAERDTLIPIVPDQEGMYTIVLMPYSTDVVVDQMGILNNFPVQQVDNGFVTRMSGSRPNINFYEINPTNDMNGQMGMLQVDGYVDQNVMPSDPTISSSFFGSGELRVFEMNHPFGHGLPNNVFRSGKTIISVTANPPILNKNDQTIVGEDFPTGYNLDIGFWGTFTPLETLPLSQDLYTNSNGLNYLLTVNQTSILSIIDDHKSPYYPTSVYLTSMDGSQSYSCYTTTCDFTDQSPNSLTVVEPGQYWVQIYGPNDGALPIAQVNLFSPESLELGGTKTLDTKLKSPQFVYLPTDNFGCDLLNLTLLGTDITAYYEVSIFDSQGNLMTTPTTYNFYQYTNQTQTYTGPSSTLSSYNLNGGYVYVNQVDNYPLNTTTPDPLNSPLTEHDKTVVSQFQIERFDNCTAPYLSSDAEVFQMPFEAFNAVPLNASRTELVGLYTFSSSIGGNRLILDTTNVGMDTVQLLTSTGNAWISTSGNLKVIDGTYHYIVELEFGTLNVTNFGILVHFEPNADGNILNGTFTTTIEHSGYYTLVAPVIGRMTFTSTQNGNIPDTIAKNTEPSFPVTTVAIILVIGVLVASGYMWRRRRSLG